MRKIAHIINPVRVREASDLFYAQPITFETMRIARDFAHKVVDVSLFSAQYSEDREFVPDDFQCTPDIDRSILDIGSFKRMRKLPILKDILDRLYDATDAEYLIFSNVDIALMPHFYLAVNTFIESGYDAFVINRRTIANTYTSVEDLPLLYSKLGEPHPGYDCFVFRREVYPRYKLGTACIGINWIGRVLIANLICFSNNFKEFDDQHLTFHIGNDKLWKNKEYADYEAHNINESFHILTELEREYGPFDPSSPPMSYIRDIERIRKQNNSQNIHPNKNNLSNKIGRALRMLVRR